MVDLGLWIASQRARTATDVDFPDWREQLRHILGACERKNFSCQGSGVYPRYSLANATGSFAAMAEAFISASFKASRFCDKIKVVINPVVSEQMEVKEPAIGRE
jgi:hypothetical protein